MDSPDPISSTLSLISDVIFTTVPIVVIVVVLTHYTGFYSVFRSPEFAFAAAVLFGQTIVKFIHISRPADVRVGQVVLVLAITIVAGLIPTLLVLFLLLVAEVGRTDPSKTLMTAQMVLLVIATLAYVTFGSVAERFSRQDDTNPVPPPHSAPSHARLNK